MRTSRFDNVKYDAISLDHQEHAKNLISQLERMVEQFGLLTLDGLTHLDTERSKATAITKLEDAYMWIGKAIANDQLGRKGRES